MCKRAEEGKGVYDTLRSVPNTFASIQVHGQAGSCAEGPSERGLIDAQKQSQVTLVASAVRL
jgi:hypothetical protein